MLLDRGLRGALLVPDLVPEFGLLARDSGTENDIFVLQRPDLVGLMIQGVGCRVKG